MPTSKDKVKRGKSRSSRYCPKCDDWYNHAAGDCPYCRTEKKCAQCKVVKPLSAFYVHRQQADGHDSECIDCCREHVHIFRTYGMTKEQYEKILKSQRGRCAICRKVPKRRLHVDHDHATGAVRGLLCIQCNHGLGNFFDDVKILDRAASYLKNPKSFIIVAPERVKKQRGVK